MRKIDLFPDKIMKYILPVFLLLVSGIAFAQKPSVADSVNQTPPTPDEFYVKVDPKPLNNIQKLVEYPEEAKRSQLEGKVTFSALIGKDGNVEKVTIDKASDEIFKQPTIDAVKKVRFSPALGPDGNPARVWYTQTVSFKMPLSESLMELKSPLYDPSGLLRADESQKILSKVQSLADSGKIQIFVVIVPSLNGKNANTTTQAICNFYKIGDQKKYPNGGAVILYARDDHNGTITTRRVLNGAPDSLLSNINRDVFNSLFSQEKYYEGIDKTVDALTELSKGK